MSTTQTITAENISILFPEVSPRLTVTGSPSATQNGTTPSQSNDDDPLAGYDAEQIRLMDEMCIVLSSSDQPIGSASKKACHLMSNIDAGLLHRAFSVFLFRPSDHRLLLQQRAAEKITFPGMWTNTCCSHPLAHGSEIGRAGDLASSVEGAKRAAVRKLGHELGIKPHSVPVADFQFLTRIHYLAPSDGKWGEHEIDYILFIEADVEPLDGVNANEVQDTRWVSRDELRQMFKDVQAQTGKDAGLKYTPWFRLICEGMLFEWWEALEKGDLGRFGGEQEIRRML